MDRSLLLLLLTAVVGVVVIARAHAPRSEKLGLALFQIVLACVAVGAILTSLLGVDGGGRSLLACAAGPLLVLLVRSPSSASAAPRPSSTAASASPSASVSASSASASAEAPPSSLVRASGPLFAALLTVGLGVEIALVLHGPRVLAAVPAVAVALVAGLLCWSSLKRVSEVHGAIARARVVDDAVAAALLILAALFAGAWAGGHLWAALLALSSSLATAARIANAPPDRRDAAVVVVGALLCAVVVDVGLLPVVACALGVAVVVGRGLLVTPRTSASMPAALSATTAPAGLGGVLPLLDDALLRRPGRPRVLARTPARRLLDAALERAQRAQPQHRGRPPVDVNVGEGDADVDGDPSELAEALCAVLDNALRQQARHPWAKISVVIRAAAQTVSFEVTDTAPEVPTDGAPFTSGRVDDVDRPGLGVSLARARLLVERHGGQLHARHGPEGSAVQLTLPRRLNRGGVGFA